MQGDKKLTEIKRSTTVYLDYTRYEDLVENGEVSIWDDDGDLELKIKVLRRDLI